MQTHRHAAEIPTWSLPLEMLFRHELSFPHPHVMHQAWERGAPFQERQLGQGRVTPTLGELHPCFPSTQLGPILGACLLNLWALKSKHVSVFFVCLFILLHRVTDLNTSNADFWITLENSYTQEMERIWWLPKYIYPLHTDMCNWESPAGPENRRPTKEGSAPTGLQNGGQQNLELWRSLEDFQVLWTWLQLTRKGRKRQLDQFPFMGDLIILFNLSRS